jgi:protein gp37
MSYVVGLPSNSYKPITNMTWLCKLQKGCNRLAAACEKVYQLLAHGRWFSLGNPLLHQHVNVTFTNCVFIVMKTLPNDYSRHWDKKKSIKGNNPLCIFLHLFLWHNCNIF